MGIAIIIFGCADEKDSDEPQTTALTFQLQWPGSDSSKLPADVKAIRIAVMDHEEEVVSETNDADFKKEYHLEDNTGAIHNVAEGQDLRIRFLAYNESFYTQYSAQGKFCLGSEARLSHKKPA
ncbi:hypothetical protein WDW89_04715 [Deltaproteobacteria bacterium TL4]